MRAMRSSRPPADWCSSRVLGARSRKGAEDQDALVVAVPCTSRLMHNAAFLAATASVLVAGLLVAIRLRLPSRLDTLLAWGMLCVGEVVGLVLLLGWVGALRTGWLLLGSLVVLAIVGLGVRGPAFSGAAAETRTKLRAFRTELTWTNVRTAPLAAFLAVLAAGQVAWCGFAAWALPPTGWDTLTYHMPAVAYWVQRGQIVRTPYQFFTNVYPLNGELTFAWPAVLLHSDALVNLGQIPFALLGAAGTAVIARTVGVRRSAAVVAASLFLLAPVVAQQMAVPYVDLALAGSFLAAFAFLLRGLQSLGLLQGGSAAATTVTTGRRLPGADGRRGGGRCGEQGIRARVPRGVVARRRRRARRRVGERSAPPGFRAPSRGRVRGSRPAAGDVLVHAQPDRAREPALSVERGGRRRRAPARPAGGPQRERDRGPQPGTGVHRGRHRAGPAGSIVDPRAAAPLQLRPSPRWVGTPVDPGCGAGTRGVHRPVHPAAPRHPLPVPRAVRGDPPAATGELVGPVHDVLPRGRVRRARGRARAPAPVATERVTTGRGRDRDHRVGRRS